MNKEKLRLKNQLCHRVYIAANAITRTYRPVLKELDLTYPQYIVLMALWEEDNLTIHPLIEKTKIDAGSLTLILNKLKEKKMLKITASKEDKRKKLVQLTKKGLKLEEKCQNIPEQMICELTDFSKYDFTQLKTLLDKFNGGLCKV